MKQINPDTLATLTRRFNFERFVREFFWSLDYVETRTPLLVQSPGLEPHIKPLEIIRNANIHQKVGPTFLPTSPEFAMKKLLALGLPRIFQICSSFRDEPNSPDHHPEFSMLEFYETESSLEILQDRVETLFQTLAIKVRGSTVVSFRGEKIDLKGPWPRLRIVDLFQEYLRVDLRTHQDSPSLARVCFANHIQADANETWDDLYFKLWLNLIEPKLPKDRPVFITHYPTSQSSLCNTVKDEKGFTWANRFELYAGTFELGNAFDELRDSKKQRANFLHDQQVRKTIYGNTYPESPIDEDFLAAIEKMPPTCGIALGLDRMAMLILGVDAIDEVIPLQSHWPL